MVANVKEVTMALALLAVPRLTGNTQVLSLDFHLNLIFSQVHFRNSA